jgi:hypothetical protein
VNKWNSACIRPAPSQAIPNDNLSNEVNRQIVQSEIEGGVHLSDLAPGIRLELQTAHHSYSILNLGEGRVEICGHPHYCPSPTRVTLRGSNWGGSLLKPSYLGRGMRLEFWHPTHELITTSRIIEIRQVG